MARHPTNQSIGGGVPGRPDGLRPPAGGPGRPAPSFLQAGPGVARRPTRNPAELPGDVRTGGPTAGRPMARPTQSTIPRSPTQSRPSITGGPAGGAGALPPSAANPNAPPLPTLPTPSVASGISPGRDAPAGAAGGGAQLAPAGGGAVSFQGGMVNSRAAQPPPGGGGGGIQGGTGSLPVQSPGGGLAGNFQPGQPGSGGFAGGGGGPAGVTNQLNPGNAPIALGGLGGLIERQLGNPSRFGSDEALSTFNRLSGRLGEQADTAEGRADVRSAGRGVFFGTPGLKAGLDARKPFEQAQGDLAATIALEQARVGGADQRGAINQAFRFGENQTSADQFAADLGLRTSGLGNAGGPDINAAVGAIAGQPLPGGPSGPTGLGGLAGLVPGLGGGAPPPQQPTGTAGGTRARLPEQPTRDRAGRPIRPRGIDTSNIPRFEV